MSAKWLFLEFQRFTNWLIYWDQKIYLEDMSREYLIVLHMGCFSEMRISIKENAEILSPVLKDS